MNAAIVYDLWQHYQVTGDWEFLSFNWGDMVLEIARLFASMTSLSANKTLHQNSIELTLNP